MSEKKDPAIKLFGKTIQLGSILDGDASVASIVEPSATEEGDCESTDSDHSLLCSKQGENRGDEKVSTGQPVDAKQDEEPSSSSALEESKTQESPSNTTMDQNPKTLSDGKESSSQDLSKKENQSDQTSSSHSQDQCPPKKPDKILPCPRCNSMDTKFCYFNNYNVNQPRHFCKNCQRYWTAGGTMRNVPVGAGRRKNKNSSTSQHRHLVTFDPPNGLIHNALRSNGSVLAFSQDTPLSESMASMLKHAEKSPNCVPNGFIEPDTRISSSCGGSRNNGKENSDSLLNNNSICMGENGGKVISQGLPPQVVCFSGTSWPYTWNPIPVPSGFPVSFCSPPTYLACNSPVTWNLQWLPTPTICPEQSLPTSTPNSPSLGKHPRDGIVLRPPNNNEPADENRSESTRVVIPKTLRIDDPTEAAKSSIWGSLGIKNDKVGSSNVVGGFFRGFEQSKDTDYEPDSQSAERLTMALQANPAAFSRSLSFHENAW